MVDEDGKFRFETDGTTYRAAKVRLWDDKTSSLKNRPPNCEGRLVRRPGKNGPTELLPSQRGEIPDDVEVFDCFFPETKKPQPIPNPREANLPRSWNRLHLKHLFQPRR